MVNARDRLESITWAVVDFNKALGVAPHVAGNSGNVLENMQSAMPLQVKNFRREKDLNRGIGFYSDKTLHKMLDEFVLVLVDMAEVSARYAAEHLGREHQVYEAYAKLAADFKRIKQVSPNIERC